MILFFANTEDSEAAGIVEAALQRSFTGSQIIRYCESDSPELADGVCAVVLNPRHEQAEWLADAATQHAKILLLGKLTPEIASLIGIRINHDLPAGADWADCESAMPYTSTESSGRIDYADIGFGALSPMRSRHLQRFDFACEWNNLGYGRIALDGTVWSICHEAQIDGAESIAQLSIRAQSDCLVYAALRDFPSAAFLWFNREVGPVDSQEWRLIEIFFSDYRLETLPCKPHLREIPLGYDAAVTMRLDCDEAIASARPLFELYKSQGLPFSLAVMTGLTETGEDQLLLREIVECGGSIFSHSHSHAADWGGSYQAALSEAESSKARLEERIPGYTVRYAVSPFHQTPDFAAPALYRAGYQGVIGGSISTEPQYLLGRGGCLPFFEPPFVSHSQQCMLHGDCLAGVGDPLAIYKAAFDAACRGQSIFGYLDHPFSFRYSYGWASEAERLESHCQLLGFFKTVSENLLFMTEEQCLDFIAMKSACAIIWSADNHWFDVEGVSASGFPLGIGYRGQWWPTGRPIRRDEGVSDE